MKIKNIITVILLFIQCQLIAAEMDLKRAVEEIQTINQVLNISLSTSGQAYCQVDLPPVAVCPEVVLNELLDNDKKGMVGRLNKIDSFLTGSEDFSTPNQICKNASVLKSFAFDHSINCTAQLGKNNITGTAAQRAADYLNSFLIDKKQNVESNMISLLSAKSQIDLLIGQDKNKIVCKNLAIKNVEAACMQVNDCSRKDEHLYNQKLDNVFDSIELIRSLKKEIRKGKNTTELNQAIDSIFEADPMLKSRAFEILFTKTNRPLNRENVSRALKDELARTRKIAINNLDKNNKAYLCMIGKSSDCHDFSEIIRTNFNNRKEVFNRTSDLYTCLENAKASRNTASQIINDSALSAALALTPMGIISVSKVLYQGSTLLKTAAAVENVRHKTLIATVAAEAVYAAQEIDKVQKSCEEKIKRFQEASKELTCKNQSNVVTLQSDIAECSSQVLAAGLAAISPALGTWSLTMAKAPAPKLLEYLNGEADNELKALLETLLKKIPDDSIRATKFRNLETKVVALLKSSESYSKDEVKNALKVIMKRCLAK